MYARSRLLAIVLSFETSKRGVDFPCKSTPYPKLLTPSKGIRFYPQAILEIPLKSPQISPINPLTGTQTPLKQDMMSPELRVNDIAPTVGDIDSIAFFSMRIILIY
jgi:hypothetical protein